MKRGGFLKRYTTLQARKGFLKRGQALKPVGDSPTAIVKQEIQDLLRAIVIIRDKKCILYGKRCYHEYGKDDVVWQAEHLIERSNSETYGDTRLVVLVCLNCHGWKHFKKSNHDQYDEWVRQVLPPDRVALWDRCVGSKWQYASNKSYDWKLVKLGLEQELKKLSTA